jgi:hypothetical protein
MQKSYDRNRSGDSDNRQKVDAIIKKELNLFFKKNMNDHRVINRLREKYSNKDIVHAVFEAYKDRQNYIQRKAKKFKQLMLTHYSDRSLTSTDLIRKAKKYQKKLGLSDDEFDMFVNLIVSDASIESDLFKLPATKMSRTLGYSQALLVTGDTLNVGVDEENVVQDILRMYGETKSLHSQVVLQSLGYSDLDDQARHGRMCKSKDNIYSYVHPVIAAFFFPKIRIIDRHLLIANLGYIVHCKKHGKPIMTQPDVELYYNLIRDPNEHVCDTESAIVDLKNRYYLQTKLWDSVLNLRQGKYYHDNLTDFLTAIDQCKSSIYDAPDLTYVKDEGAILRRVLAAFSLRPTLVATTRLWGIMSKNPYNLQVDALTRGGITRLTNVPMATLRLPVTIGGMTEEPLNLKDALSQPQWFVENNMIVPKKQEIIHSSDILVFYVGRRFKTINITRLNNPYNFQSLPMTVAGWETMNEHPVAYDDVMRLRNEVFLLRSVVCVKQTSVDQDSQNVKMITGCCTYVKEKYMNDSLKSALNNEDASKLVSAAEKLKTWWKYDPQQAGINKMKGDGQTLPFYKLPKENVKECIKKNGTIFLYEKLGSAHNFATIPTM